MSKGGKQSFAELSKKIDLSQAGKSFDMAQVDDALQSSLEDLPVVVQRRVRALKNNHKDYLALDKQYRDEVTALDRKYQKLYAPLYLKRSTIANGEYEPTDAEAHIEGEEPLAKADDKEKDIKGIPKFWLTVIQNNMAVAQTVTESDEPALAFLQDVRYSTMEDSKQGFVLTFHFAENPYFTDSILTKSYFLAEDDNLYGELIFDHAEGTKINWKQGKNLTKRTVKKTQKAGRGGRGRKGGAPKTITTEEACESFFLFFSPPERPEEEKEEEDEEEEGLLDDLLEADFEEGCIFKDKLIPHSVLWFTGEAAEMEDDYNDYGFDEYDEEDEDDEDDEDDEEEEEEEERPKRGGGRGGNSKPNKGNAGGGVPRSLPPPASGKGAAQPPQPECKQQ